METKYISYRTKKRLRKIFTIAQTTLIIIMIAFSTVLLSANLFHKKQCAPDYFGNNFLEMRGNIKQAIDWEFGIYDKLDSVEVTIFNQKNQAITSFFSNKNGDCSIKLPLNDHYILKVSKQGWLSKLIEVDTRVRGDKMKRYRLLFDIDMFEDITGLESSVLLNPVAYVAYNDLVGRFDYNYKYTEEVNKKLKKLYLDYYHIRKTRGSK